MKLDWIHGNTNNQWTIICWSMMINNITPSIGLNNWLKSVDTACLN